MCDDNDQTKPSPPAFDFSAFPENTLFHERRDGPRRRKDDAPDPEPAARGRAGADQRSAAPRKTAAAASIPPHSRSNTLPMRWNS